MDRETYRGVHDAEGVIPRGLLLKVARVLSSELAEGVKSKDLTATLLENLLELVEHGLRGLKQKLDESRKANERIETQADHAPGPCTLHHR